MGSGERGNASFNKRWHYAAMPRSRFHFTEPEHRKRHVGVDDRIVRVITLLVLIGLVAGIDYVHPAFLYR